MKFRALILLTLALSLFAPRSMAQNHHKIDSLRQLLIEAKHDTDKINILYALEDAFFGNNTDTSVLISQEIVALADKNLKLEPSEDLKEKCLASKAESLNNLGYYQKNLGHIEEALKSYLQSFKMNKVADNKEGMGYALSNIGVVYSQLGNIEEALDYLDQGLRIREEMGDTFGVAQSLISIGVIYAAQDDFPNALDHYNRSLEIFTEMDKKYAMAVTLNNIGGIYRDLGENEKALEFHERSQELREEIGDRKGFAAGLVNIGTIYDENGNAEKALNNFLRGLAIQQKVGWKDGEASTLVNIGFVYIRAGELDKALEYANSGMQLSQELGYPDQIERSTDLLYQVNAKRGNYKEALKNYELHIKMSDSMKNEATQKATIRQQTKYEFEKAQLVSEQKEKEEARLAQETTSRRDNLQYSVIIIVIIILVIGILSVGVLGAVQPIVAEGLIFFVFLIFFEFMLVLADPYIEVWSKGAPGIKLLFNAGIAALIFPLHSLFETLLKKRLVK